jgi:hypothetical protein
MDQIVEQHLAAVRNDVIAGNWPPLKNSLRILFTYLSSPAGRTTVNCSAVQYAFLLDDELQVKTMELPKVFADFFDDITSGSLHDTVESPKIAVMFDSTPEHYLKKIEKLPE